MELGFPLEPEIAAVPARVPGSVQGTLRNAGLLPDWYEGLNSRRCEWVEHREWMFSAKPPRRMVQSGAADSPSIAGGSTAAASSSSTRSRWRAFDNAFVPYDFDLTEHVRPNDNQLHIIFFVPPRWLGQIGYTSQMKEWKPRFNYGWDWIPRLVQIGPWEPVTLIATDGDEISEFRCRTEWDITSRTGSPVDEGEPGTEARAGRVRLTLRHGGAMVKLAQVSGSEFAQGVQWQELPVQPWWPNGDGGQPLYSATCELLDEDGNSIDRQDRTVGFKHVAWRRAKEPDRWPIRGSA